LVSNCADMAPHEPEQQLLIVDLDRER